MSISYYSNWKSETWKCLHCKWSGLGSELEQGDVFEHLFEMCCPNCGEHVLVIPHPTNEESRANWDKVSTSDKKLVEINERHHADFASRKLSSPDQLPDLAGDDLVFVWDVESCYFPDTIIRHGDTIIWQEPAFFEGYERFIEAAGILSQKYGTRFQDLIQTEESEQYLYGDKCCAPDAIERTRQQIRSRVIIKQQVSDQKPPNPQPMTWTQFEQKLATVLEKVKEGQYLILLIAQSSKYVQFACQRDFGLRAETTSNAYLPAPEKLNEQQISNLLKAGWHAPTWNPTESTPEVDPDGSPNFFVEFSAPISFGLVANLAVHTFAEILLVPAPDFLEYCAIDEVSENLVLPELGLKLEDRASQDTTALKAAITQYYEYDNGNPMPARRIGKEIPQFGRSGEWVVFPNVKNLQYLSGATKEQFEALCRENNVTETDPVISLSGQQYPNTPEGAKLFNAAADQLTRLFRAALDKG